MQDNRSNHFKFSNFELDSQARMLSRAGERIALRPRSFDVLACLLANAGSLVTKDSIFAAVWPDVIASDESLTKCVSEIRHAIGDVNREIIQTVPGRGYQFAADVATDNGDGRWPPVASSRKIITAKGWGAVAATFLVVVAGLGFLHFSRDTATGTLRASIAVLPFHNTTHDRDVESLVTGLTSDLISALGRVPEMLVISESTARRYKNDVADIREVATTLGVQHVLAGAVQRSGDQVRVSVQLLDKDKGAAVWTGRYDRKLSDFLKLQDDIVKRVLVGLQVKLTHGETARLMSRRADNLEAWLAHIEGLAEGFQFKRENNQRARELFTQASALDPGWAAPVSGIAWTYREAVRRGWSHDPSGDRKEWLRLAGKCREMDPDFAGCYIQLGNYHIENHEVAKGIALREKALELAPNDLSVLSGLAWQLILVGEVNRGLEMLQRAKLVSPIHPGWLLATEAYGYQVNGQFDKAIKGFQAALGRGDFPDWHARLAAVYVQVGDMENAQKHALMFKEKRPNRKVADLTQILKIQDPALTRQYAQLLREAGIPE